MSKKQDSVFPRTASDLERKYNFNKTFSEIMGLAASAQRSANDAQEAAENARKAYEGLDQDQIFNLLTNYGEEQGIYRGDDGLIYINASYIKSGKFLADLIETGILKSSDDYTFFLDLDNGVLRGNFTELNVAGETVFDIADTAAANAVDNQSQEDIFNKLTNYGTLPGLFMYEGELYINASYITSGEIDAGLVKVINLDADNIITGTINAEDIEVINLNADNIKTGVITSADGSVKVDLLNNAVTIETTDDSGDGRIEITSKGIVGYGKDDATGVYEKTLHILPGNNGNRTQIGIGGYGGGLSISTISEGAQIYLYADDLIVDGTRLRIGGMDVSWEANGDGTYRLVGTT